MAQQVTITLLSGDYPQRLLKLADAVGHARKTDVQLLASEQHPAEVLAEEYETLRVEAEEAGTRVVLNAIGRKSWRLLKAAHPPRTEADGADTDTAKADRRGGINLDESEDDLVHASILEPAEFKCARDQRDQSAACTNTNPCTQRHAYMAWAEDDLSAGEFAQLSVKAYAMSQSAAIDPKALPSWQIPSDDEN